MDIFAPKHLIMILLIVLLVFGTKKLRTIGADLGGAVKGFKDSMRHEQITTHNATDAIDTSQVPSNTSHS